MKLNEAIQLDIDERNDLDFSIRVEGADNAASSVRMVIDTDDVSYMFNGRLTNEANVVKFSLPPFKHLKEGTYPARVEVVVENKFFLPVEFDIFLKRPVAVFVEQVQVARKVEAPVVTVTAAPVVPAKKVVEHRPIPVVQQQPNKQTISLKEKYASTKSK